MKFRNNYIILFLTAFLLTNCEDLSELNENPNQPEEISPDVLFTSSLRNSANIMVMESFLLGNNVAQLTSKTLRTEVDVYSWNAFPTVWEGLYETLANTLEVENLAAAEGNVAMEAAAKIYKVYLYSTLTMAYGDIPYSEAIKGVSEDDWSPAYDSQQEIITGEGGLLVELEEANTMLASGGGTIDGDIIFAGNAANWQKFGNSLRLRLLMHLSNKQDVSAEFADIVNNEPIMTSNNDNAVLEYTGTFPNEFPLFPLKQGDFDAVVMSQSLVSVLQDLDDPRLGRYARPDNIVEVADDPDVEPVFDGAVNGLETGGCDKSGSRLGLRYFSYPGHPTADNQANGIIMTYAEVEFLIAEAAQKGIISVDAGAHYEAGVKAGMDYYDVNYMEFGWTDFADYYANSGVGYDGELLSVWRQKWIALFFHGLEPYFEIRRWMYESGFDWSALTFVNPPCENTNNDMLPVRFLYPGSEQTLNAENYNAVIDRLGENSQNAEMWLMKE